MSLAKRLFRESALERLSSPEQLDQQLRVTSPKGWMALCAMWVLLAAVITWSIVGEVPTKEEGRGIIVPVGDLTVVEAESSGRLRKIFVGVGDEVSTEQLVALIDRPDISEALAEAEAQLAELRTQEVLLEDLDARQKALQEELAEDEAQRLEKIIGFSDAHIKRLDYYHQVIKGLVDDGMMTEVDLHRVEEDRERAELEIEQARLRMAQLEASNREADFQRERERKKRQLEIQALERRVDMLRERERRESEVRSPVSGRVVEVRATVDATLARGDHVLVIAPPGELEAILFLSAETGKRVNKEDEVQISPTTARREKFGAIVGIVSYVAPTTTAESRMLTVLTAPDLVEQLTQEVGVPLEVRVTLTRDPSTRSGYKWTTSSGPDEPIKAGTICRGWITVDRQRPVELVIPLARKAFGG